VRPTRCASGALLALLVASGCGSGRTGGHGGSGGIDPIADQTQIVALALGGGKGAGTHSPTRVYVDERYCRIIDAGRRGPCSVRPIPDQVRAGVLKVVGSAYRFVGQRPEPSRTRIVVALGAPVIRGDSATIAMDSMCGPLCGSGTTIQLRRDAGRWHEVGERKNDWIS
jgi:hypothetical protein